MNRPRRRWTVVLVTAGVMAASCASEASPAPPRSAADAAAASAVEILATGCRVDTVHGVGAMVAADGNNYVLTAAHVVAGATSIVVVAAGRPAVEGIVVALDRDNDLALVLTSLDLPGLAIDPVPARAGAVGAVVVVRDGAPSAIRFRVVTRAAVQTTDISADHDVSRPGYRIEARIEPGDSGGVMVDQSGRAVGVLYARSNTTVGDAFATDLTPLPALVAAAVQTDPATVGRGACAAS